MPRRYPRALLTVCFVALLVGCGGDDEPSTSSPETPTESAEVAGPTGLEDYLLQDGDIPGLVPIDSPVTNESDPFDLPPGGAEVLQRMRRRSLSVLRRQIEAVDPPALVRFAHAWHGIGGGGGGPARLMEAIERLQGAAVPASPESLGVTRIWTALVSPTNTGSVPCLPDGVDMSALPESITSGVNHSPHEPSSSCARILVTVDSRFDAVSATIENGSSRVISLTDAPS